MNKKVIGLYLVGAIMVAYLIVTIIGMANQVSENVLVEVKTGDVHPEYERLIFSELVNSYVPVPENNLDLGLFEAEGKYLVFNEVYPENLTRLMVLRPSGEVAYTGLEVQSNSWTVSADCQWLVAARNEPFNGTHILTANLHQGEMSAVRVGIQKPVWVQLTNPVIHPTEPMVAFVSHQAGSRSVLVDSLISGSDLPRVMHVAERNSSFYISQLAWLEEAFQLGFYVAGNNGLGAGAYVGVDIRSGTDYVLETAFDNYETHSLRNFVVEDYGDVFGMICSKGGGDF